MTRLLIILTILMFLVPPIYAKEEEPISLPEWMTPECFNVISTIVQHEVGNVPSKKAREFVAAQVIMDAKKMGCKNLTKWRWAIKSWPKPSTETKNIVWSLPQYPKCKFVGNWSDVAIWRSYGYRARVDYLFKSGRYIVVGADCDLHTSAPSIDKPAMLNMSADK